MLFYNKKNKVQKNTRHNISFFEGMVFWFRNLNFVKHIFVFYLLITFVGSGILMLPFSHRDVSVKYIDALFTAASAFSDTGLSTINATETWTIFGQFVISILILVGGIGWFALKIFVFNILFNKPISLTSRAALAGERGNVRFGDTRDLIKVSVISIFVMMTLSGLILSIYFYYSPMGFNEDFAQVGKFSGASLNPQGNWNTSIRYGVFHSISAINNAGFDIMGGHSISPYFKDYFVQIMFLMLFIFGGIGYPVIYDVKEYFHNKRKGQYFRFSLFTKVSCITYAFVSIVGIMATFISELSAVSTTDNPAFWDPRTKLSFPPEDGRTIEATITQPQKVMALFFNTMSTRNAGFSTINFHTLNSATLIIHSIMMFIGSAPSSTAGGIRTTTFAIVCLSFWTHIRGKSSTRVFRRRINENTVRMSYVVTTISIFLVLLTSLISLTSLNVNGGPIKMGSKSAITGKTEYNYVHLLFETASAFGTTGLSTGLTPDISLTTKIFFIFIMFVGQLGVSSAILSFGSKKQSTRGYKFVEEDITIG